MPIIGLEWIWIVLIIIIFLVGPKKLPEVAKTVGRAMGEFQKAKQQIDAEIKSASQQIDNEVKSATEVIKDSTSEISEVSKRKNLFDAAQALGIFPYGKTNDELGRMIKEKIDEKKDILPKAQEEEQQTVQAMVKTDHPQDDSLTNKPTGQLSAVVTKTKSEQKLKDTDLRKRKSKGIAAKKKTNPTAPIKSQSKTRPRNRKTHTS
ncbi:MAG: twin-arginine translocase TatA/TatE family subunit [Thaumarchaeota archaeon]|nr:twin-arginine translocase TatA/TatE family subunit [Nitrososphaerota archaeon]